MEALGNINVICPKSSDSIFSVFFCRLATDEFLSLLKVGKQFRVAFLVEFVNLLWNFHWFCGLCPTH